MYDAEFHRKLNEEAASDPRPGDCWYEIFCPVALVVARSGGFACVCRGAMDSEDGSAYSYVTPRWERVDRFKRSLQYDSTSSRFYCDVRREDCDVSGYRSQIPALTSGALTGPR